MRRKAGWISYLRGINPLKFAFKLENRMKNGWKRLFHCPCTFLNFQVPSLQAALDHSSFSKYMESHPALWVRHCRPRLYRPQARAGGSSHGFCGAWYHGGAGEEGRKGPDDYDHCARVHAIIESTIDV